MKSPNSILPRGGGAGDCEIEHYQQGPQGHASLIPFNFLLMKEFKRLIMLLFLALTASMVKILCWNGTLGSIGEKYHVYSISADRRYWACNEKNAILNKKYGCLAIF